jgi:hypothetical protein
MQSSGLGTSNLLRHAVPETSITYSTMTPHPHPFKKKNYKIVFQAKYFFLQHLNSTWNPLKHFKQSWDIQLPVAANDYTIWL